MAPVAEPEVAGHITDEEARHLEQYRQGGLPLDGVQLGPLASDLYQAMVSANGHDRDAALKVSLDQLPDSQGDGVRARLIRVDPDHGPWPAPRDLPSAVTVPAMTPDMAPTRLRDWAVDQASVMCFPLEYVLIAAIVALGSVVGRLVGIRPGAFGDFVTVPNLWGVIVGDPGWLKTPALNAGVAFINELEARERRAYEERVPRQNAAAERHEQQVQAIKKRLQKTINQDGDPGALEAELAALVASPPDATPQRRFVTNDATVEKLHDLLRDNSRGMLVFRDELAGLLKIFERANREGERQFYLQSWVGTTSFTYDRMQRGTVYIETATVSVLGSMQPGPLHKLVVDATSGGEEADGFLQRLQLFVWPDRLPPWCPQSRESDEAAHRRARAVYERLADITPEELGATIDEGRIPYLRFAPDAQRRADAWATRRENLLRGESLAATPAFASHLSKYRSLIPELALLFHLADGGIGPVRLEALELALTWEELLEAHARKLYASELSPGVDAAHALLAKMHDQQVKDGETVRAIKRHHWSDLIGDQVDAALERLEEFGWVQTESALSGGRPSHLVRLHPCLLRGGEPR